MIQMLKVKYWPSMQLKIYRELQTPFCETWHSQWGWEWCTGLELGSLQHCFQTRMSVLDDSSQPTEYIQWAFEKLFVVIVVVDVVYCPMTTFLNPARISSHGLYSMCKERLWL